MKPLAETVYVDGRRHVRGTIPPVDDAKRITNPLAWEDGEVPDLDGAEDDGTTTPPITTAPTGAVPVMGGDRAIPAGDQPAAVTTAEAPAGNASAEKWRTWVVESGRATTEEVDGLSRDELRDRYAPKA